MLLESGETMKHFSFLTFTRMEINVQAAHNQIKSIRAYNSTRLLNIINKKK